MPPTELVKSLADDSFLASVLRRKKRSLTEAVPADIDPREALANIKECVSSLNRLGNATSVVGAILGAHMAVVAKRPEIYEAAGYESLKSFEQAEIISKVSHGSVYNYKAIHEAFPEITIQEVLDTGSTNLVRAARVVKSIGDASPSQKRKILDKAAELDTGAFTDWLETKSGVAGKGDTTTDSFLLIGSSAQIAELKQWLADSGLTDWAGTDQPVEVVLRAIQAATAEFTSPAAEEIQTGAPTVVESEEWG